MGSEKGSTLIETLVALALMGAIAATFFGALSTAPRVCFVADEQASARFLAESQMENVKKQEFSASYNVTPIPEEHPGYAATIGVDPQRNSQIQKITVNITHHGREITSLECYKTNR